MIPYWLLFLLPAWLAVARLRPVQNRSARWPGLWHVIFWLLVLVIGLRHEVGVDWDAYVDQVEMVDTSLQEALRYGDPAYSLLNWLAAETGFGIYFVNTVCAMLFAWGLVAFCRAQPRPWLALTVAIPYLVTVVAMGYSRQGVAIGLAMLGLVALLDRKTLRFVVFVALAATFHKTAVILIPLAIFVGAKLWIWKAFWIGIFSLLFYALLLQEQVEAFMINYIEAEYQSRGADIRVAMNAMSAALFLWFRRRFVMPKEDRTFWTWMSLLALVFVVLLEVSPSSTAVDRMALYFIPLQLVVLSRLPDVIGKPSGSTNLLVTGVVVAYSAAVLFIWLFFADHAYAWLPYQFYPLVGLL